MMRCSFRMRSSLTCSGLSTFVLCLPAAYILRAGVQPRPTQPLSGTQLTPTREKSIFKSSMYLRVVLTCVIVSWPFFIPPFYLPQYGELQYQLNMRLLYEAG